MRILYPANISIKFEGRTWTFLDKNKSLKLFLSTLTQKAPGGYAPVNKGVNQERIKYWIQKQGIQHRKKVNLRMTMKQGSRVTNM